MLMVSTKKIFPQAAARFGAAFSWPWTVDYSGEKGVLNGAVVVGI